MTRRQVHLGHPAPAGSVALRAHACRRDRRCALILPVVLVILVLLALLVSSFAFQVQADFNAGSGMAQRLQTRLAAEAGVHAAMVRLRTDMDNPTAWFDNAEAFDQALVWAPEATPDLLGKGSTVREDDQGSANLVDLRAIRFSLVADDPEDEEDNLEDGNIRFGITDEASKLNINVASAQQLVRLFQPVVVALGLEEPVAQELADAVVDWRDADDDATNEEKPAESAYYGTLNPPYRAKNAPFETVEELLMVRGFNGRILYGEDYDRNGLLSPLSEDDGPDVFPADNADGVLERGIYPFITVFSREYNTSSENKPRLYLFGNKATVQEKLSEIFERPEVVDFLVAASQVRGQKGIRTLADYLEPKIINDRLTNSPLNRAEIDLLFDRCSVDSQPEQIGLVNVNTADPIVLRALGMSQEIVSNIVTARRSLPPSERATLGWLMASAGVTADQFAESGGLLTARSRQFTIESIGFTDNRGLFTRLQAVVTMRGPIAQLIYYRDITKLGMGFPVRGQEGERRFALEADL